MPSFSIKREDVEIAFDKMNADDDAVRGIFSYYSFLLYMVFSYS
jgi:hypothetical protein